MAAKHPKAWKAAVQRRNKRPDYFRRPQSYGRATPSLRLRDMQTRTEPQTKRKKRACRSKSLNQMCAKVWTLPGKTLYQLTFVIEWGVVRGDLKSNISSHLLISQYVHIRKCASHYTTVVNNSLTIIIFG